MFVAENEEQVRKVIREEVRAAVRELVTVQASSPATDPEAILGYESAGALVDQDRETVRAWTNRGLLARYKCQSGRAVGVKRGELLALWKRMEGKGPEPREKDATDDEKADAILRGKRKR